MVSVWLTFYFLWRFEPRRQTWETHEARRARLDALGHTSIQSARARRLYALAAWGCALGALALAANADAPGDDGGAAARRDLRRATLASVAVLVGAMVPMSRLFVMEDQTAHPISASISAVISAILLGAELVFAALAARHAGAAPGALPSASASASASLAAATSHVLGGAACAVALIAEALLISRRRRAIDDEQASRRLLSALGELRPGETAEDDQLFTRSDLVRAFESLGLSRYAHGSALRRQWHRQLDPEGQGSVTRARIAAHFRLDATRGDERLSYDLAMLEAGVLDGAYLDRRLQELHSSKLAQRAGGVLRWFVLWDAGSFACISLYIVLKLRSEIDISGGEISLDDWRLRTTLYFGKMCVGFAALPFLLFKVPMLKDWLTHTCVTAYDASGRCLPVLNVKQKQQRYYEFRRLAELRNAEARGAWSACTAWWEACLGSSEEAEALRTLARRARRGTPGAGTRELAAEKRQRKLEEDAENMVNKARDERLNRFRSLAFEHRPEASLMHLTRDPEDGRVYADAREAVGLTTLL